MMFSVDADGNRKRVVFPFTLSSHNHIYIVKYLSSIRDGWYKAGVFKFVLFEERFRKVSFFLRVSVDGRPNNRNKVVFLNVSSMLWTGP